MKKHLLAVAVASTIVVPAFAQNVTISGRVGAAFTATDNSNGANTSVQDAGSDAFQTNVLQIAGSEDLGGGLKAGFVLQGTLATSSGLLGNGANTASDGALFDRQSYLEVSGAFGSIRMGRVSDMLDSTEGYANHVNLFDTEAANIQGLGNKNPSSVRWDSGKLLGDFSLGAHYSSDARAVSSNATTAGTATSKNISVAAAYSAKGLTLGAAHGQAGAPGNGGVGGAMLQTMYAGYVIQGVDVRVQQTTQTAAGAAGAKTKTTEGSARYDLGGGITVIGHIERMNVDTTDTTDYSQVGVFLTKDLSKRTALFTGYRKKDLKAATSVDATTTTVGISHVF
jgi:hypothetical protein